MITMKQILSRYSPVSTARYVSLSVSPCQAKKNLPSVSGGTFARQLDPIKLVLMYAEHGATAISVLTSEKFFHGALADGVAVGSEQVRRAQEKDGVEHVRTCVSGLRWAAIRGRKGER